MLIKIASLIAIAYLPGAIIFRLPLAGRSKRASLPAEERAFWAIMISVIVSMTAAFALASVGGYSLSRVVWGNTVIFDRACARLARQFAARPGGTPAAPERSDSGCSDRIGRVDVLAAPAAEYVIGGRDPGVYISEGIQIAQRQSLVTTDSVAAAVPASARDLFFRPPPARPTTASASWGSTSAILTWAR